jgi:hypothetical protein
MAWSWSHSPEAYANALRNLEELSKEVLEEIYAEWQACNKENEYLKRVWQLEVEFGKTTFNEPDFDNNAWCQDNYDIAIEAAKDISADVLAESIWGWAESHAVCDNGGFNAWVCPTGCHRVSFDYTGDCNDAE